MEYPAIVDIETGKINNCRPNSFEEKHEQAHIEFSKLDKGAFMQWLCETAMFYTIISITITFFISFFKYISLIGIAIMLFTFIYEELWCDNCAKSKIEKNKKREIDKSKDI